MKNQLIKKWPDNSKIRIGKGFWGRYQCLVRDVMLPYQWQALNDSIPDAPPSHSIANMRLAGEKNAAGAPSGQYAGQVFQDSDVYKWLEAVAWQLSGDDDPVLRAEAEETINLIAAAQESDGYLNTYYTLTAPDKKWSNLRDNHELYCSGHMIEAAVAWYLSTGQTQFLDIAERNVEHIMKVFGDGPGKKRGYPGHPEIELALVRLYMATGKKEYLEQAEFFIRERGRQPNYFELEADWRNDNRYWAAPISKPPLKYCQADKPLSEQDNLEGHAVRALYLLSGLIDVAAATGAGDLLDTARRLWQNAVGRRMYVTGGVGSSHHGEAFTFDFDLPNDTVYAETCASIALIFAARRLLELDLDSQYADVMERALYNTCLGSLQMDGTRFLYVNPLAVWPQASEKDVDHWHVTPERQKWFGCACCPPNLARLLASLGQYAYGADDRLIQVHLYLESKTEFAVGGGQVKLDVKTEYPVSGLIEISKSGEACRLALRIPDWCPDYSIQVGQENLQGKLKQGYRIIDCPQGDVQVRLELEMPVMRIYASPAVPENAGKVCLQRGPLVYCLEEADNGRQLWTRKLPQNAIIQENFEPDMLGGIVTLSAAGKSTQGEAGALYRFNQGPAENQVNLKFIPYYTWSNRTPGEMIVWLNEEKN